MSTGGTVYVITTEGLRVYISSFNPFAASPITPSYFLTYGSSTYEMVASSTFMVSTYDQLYISGSIDQEMLLLKIDPSLGLFVY